MTQKYTLSSIPPAGLLGALVFQGHPSAGDRHTTKFGVFTNQRSAGPIDRSVLVPETWVVALTGGKQTSVSNLNLMQLEGHVISPHNRKGPFMADIDLGKPHQPGTLTHKKFVVKS